ncbi:MAG: FecR domain-containing protein [Muribaculaceae bacterium]|nr:FecR domain-containing protein [Muribaculaceae bacterium]
MNPNTASDIDIIIARYLAGDATEEETGLLLQWIEESDSNRRDFFEQKDIWHALHPTFDTTDIDVDAARRNVLARTGIAPGKSRRWKVISVAAACALAATAMAAVLARIAMPAAPVPEYTIATAYGYTMETVLPDGTGVWLNANSTLRYPAEFRGAGRDVTLTGEAYFSVEADAEHPFRVHTPDMTVTATGTQFNVNAYEISPTSNVTLVEGKVDVSAEGHTYTMRTGEHLALGGGKAEITRKANIDKYCAWRDGILLFDNDCLKDICARLEQIHNVEFRIDPAVETVNFHIILKGESISEIMHMMEMSASLACETEERDEKGDGRQRQRITISARDTK